MSEEVHIGALIKKKMDGDGRKVTWLAEKTALSRSQIYRMYKQQYIAVNQLVSINIHLEADFFACYSEYLRQQAQWLEKPEYTGGKIHIGALIKEQVGKGGYKVAWLADKMRCSESNIYRIFDKQYIDIELLTRFCIHLKTDFFACYSEYVRRQIREKYDKI